MSITKAVWAFFKFRWLFNQTHYVISLLLPFVKSSGVRRLDSTTRRALRLLLILIIVVVLFFVNKYIAHLVRVHWARDIFLPLTFLLGIALIWTGWGIWKLLRAEPEASDFPTIDEAWDVAVRALAQAGIRLGDVPLFLVLGRPQGPEEHLFAAADLSLVVKQSPPDPLAPLHVYASRNGIYVTCAGASLLGKHAANIALEGIEEYGAGGGEGDGDNPEADRTIRPGGKEKEVIKQLARLVGRPMSVAERRATRRKLGKPLPELRKNPAEITELCARLTHLGRLIVRDRQPECPINGVMVLIPAGGTDTEHEAQQTADMCARDLATIRRLFQLQCPVLVLVCDMEAVPGFRDFIERVSPKERKGRLGQRFPLASPDLEGEPLQEEIDKSVHFLCNSYLRDWVYRLFRMDPDGGIDSVATNTGLYLFLDEMRDRKKCLSRILKQGIAKDGPVPLLYAGCYLAGTGSDQALEQAFVAGVFNRLEKNQSFVAWTDQAFAEDRKCHWHANLGYGILVGMVLVVLAVGFVFLRKGPHS